MTQHTHPISLNTRTSKHMSTVVSTYQTCYTRRNDKVVTTMYEKLPTFSIHVFQDDNETFEAWTTAVKQKYAPEETAVKLDAEEEDVTAGTSEQGMAQPPEATVPPPIQNTSKRSVQFKERPARLEINQGMEQLKEASKPPQRIWQPTTKRNQNRPTPQDHDDAIRKRAEYNDLVHPDFQARNAEWGNPYEKARQAKPTSETRTRPWSIKHNDGGYSRANDIDVHSS